MQIQQIAEQANLNLPSLPSQKDESTLEVSKGGEHIHEI